jgi:alpha-tubulin suppressor-like RCC1 family protein
MLFPFPRTFPGVKENHIWQGHANNGKLIDQNDELWTWGRLDYGSTGIGADAFVPVNVMTVEDGANPFRRSAGGLKVKFIAHTAGTEGRNTAGVIGSDDKVYMAGWNESGQLGRGNTDQSNWFIQVPYFNTVVEGQPAVVDPDTGETTVEAVDPRTIDWLSMGRERYTHCVAVDDAFRAHVWGRNAQYELGNNSTVDSTLPFIANNGTLAGKNVKKAWANYRATWFLCTDDTLHVCGTDYYGNTGVNGNTGSGGVNTNSRIPTLTATDVQEIAMVYYTDYQSTWILKTDGTLYACGYNGYGQLGSNGTSAQSTWAAIDMNFLQPGESVTKMISGGDGSYSSFGVLTDQGRLYTCGYNGQGQLGLGHASHMSTLTPVICRDYITDASFYGNGSSDSLMVLLEDGQVLTCGAGENRQMASEDTEDYWVLNPVRF